MWTLFTRRYLPPLILASVLSFVTFLPDLASAKENRAFGLLVGGSFPKFLFARAQLNFFERWAVDYQTSFGIFWAIQQGDLYYFFSRGEWSPYIGVGYQTWNFYGFNSSTSVNGIIPGFNNQAAAVTLPLGLLYVADSGFAMDIDVAVDYFFVGDSNLIGKVIPEIQVGVGYFF